MQTYIIYYLFIHNIYVYIIYRYSFSDYVDIGSEVTVDTDKVATTSVRLHIDEVNILIYYVKSQIITVTVL